MFRITFESIFLFSIKYQFIVVLEKEINVTKFLEVVPVSYYTSRSSIIKQESIQIFQLVTILT